LEIYRLLFFLGTIWMTEFFIVCEANPWFSSLFMFPFLVCF
jgi:hypothetical protein